MAQGHKEYDCIVLGAGISGVTAARDLHQEGFRVLVLEGSARIGGRMYSLRDFVRHPDHAADAARFPLEAGAEYVHVSDRDRFPEFFAELDRHGFVTKKFPKFQRNRLAFPDWKRNPKHLLLALLRNTNLIPTVTLLGDVDDFEAPEDMPAGDFIATKKYKGKGLRLARYTLSSHTPGELYDAALDAFQPPGISTCRAPSEEALDTISIAGFQADRLPWQLFYEPAERKLHRARAGDDTEVVPYDELPAKIARQLLDPTGNPNGAPGEVLLEQRVVRVERRGRKIAVIAETPDGEQREFVGRSAICTFSAGMLSPETGDGGAIFGPLLTEPKRAALRSIRMGPITKLSLEFKKSHWGRKSRMTVLSHPTGCARTFFSAYPNEKKGPFVLTALLMNQDHRIVQDLEDDAAVQHLLDVLQSLFDRKGERWTAEKVLVPRAPGSSEPNFHRQDWERDPFARGGNSFIAYRPELDTAAVGRLRETLRDPRETLPLFWAGEATAPAYDADYQPLAVHGAYISGAGAARDVREFLAAGRQEEAFRNACKARMERVAAARVTAGSTRTPLTVHLTEQEHTRLGMYADARTGGDLVSAVRELFRIGVYLQEHHPRTLKARTAKKDPARAVSFTMCQEEGRCLRRYAGRHTDGDVERAVRALLRRALQAGFAAA